MPAPVVRRRSARSCTRTVQPRCARAQAAVSPANPAPAISAWRLFIGILALLASRDDGNKSLPYDLANKTAMQVPSQGVLYGPVAPFCRLRKRPRKGCEIL